MSMRIALVSTLRTPVPPTRTGSVELIVGLMAEELVGRGHEVTVFATGDSKPAGRLVSVFPRGYHEDESIWDWRLAEFMQLGAVYERAEEFDVIHSHVYCYALPFARLVSTPTVHTFHICPPPEFVRYCSTYPDQSYVLISEFQRRFFGEVEVARVVYNGIRTADFPHRTSPGDYLAYIGDIRPDKGPLEAIREARAHGVPIKIAGPDTSYLQEVIVPELDGSAVEYVGEVDHAGKTELLSGALALVFPSQGLEACPLVILEALACGTPVLGYDRGPLPELVPAEAGVLVDDLSELGAALPRLAGIDRGRVRELAVERFDVARMVDDYIDVFEDSIQGRLA